MSVSGKRLHKKIKKLRPDLAATVTPEILDTICDDPTTQPFLQWFCDNVSQANVLTKEEIDLKNQLQKTGEWLTGQELDEALEEYTQDNPELLKSIDFEDEDIEEMSFEYETLKELNKMKEDYIESLKDNISNLKKLECKLEDEIEQAEDQLKKEQIELVQAFNDCNVNLEKLDKQNRSFFKEMEQLLNVYTDAAENKGEPILWIQMPINLFIKKIKLYNDYLDILIKQQFSSDNQEDKDRKEKEIYRQKQELALCKSKLTDSMFKKVYAKLREAAGRAMLEYVRFVWNNGDLKIPEETHLQAEIVDLKKRRDFLEEKITLLREGQLTKAIEQYVETEVAQVLKQAARAKLKRRNIRFGQLKYLLSLTREHGHTYSDLLCILMDMQFHTLKEISEFIGDARHYLATEYSLSSSRCEIMRQQQKEYDAFQASIIDQNVFNELFISMASIDDVSPDALNRALAKYNDLIADNKEKKQAILDTYMKEQISKISLLEEKVLSSYDKETNNGITKSLVPLSYDLNVQYENTSDQLESIKANVMTIRNLFKETMINNKDLKREKEILWQRFLADPETLKKHYEEMKRMADRSHFRRGSE